MFDREFQQAGLSGLGGGFIKNALKKIGRAVEKSKDAVAAAVRDVKSEIADKTLPNKVQEIGRDLDKKGVVKLAASVALTIVTAGVGAPAIAVAAAAIASKALSDSGARDNQRYQLEKAEERMLATIEEEEARATKEVAEAIAALPEFQKVVDFLREQGYSDIEIAAHWAESRTYYEAAAQSAAAVVGPLVETEVAAAGITGEEAQYVTQQLTTQIAQEGVQLAKSEIKAAAGEKADLSIPLLMIAIAGMVFLI